MSPPWLSHLPIAELVNLADVQRRHGHPLLPANHFGMLQSSPSAPFRTALATGSKSR